MESKLVLNVPLKLLAARRRGRLVGVVVEVAQGGEEGTLLVLCLLEVLLFEHLLVKPPLDLCLPEVSSRLHLHRPE
jgi:hypothetical protein